MDNTYCSPACRFPSRDDSTADIIDIIQSHPKHDIVLGLRSLGKETLLCKIAMTFEEWISVPFKFYETLKTLQAPDVFQNNDVDCRIRVEPFHKITNKFVDNLNERTQTLAILPTAIYCGIEARPFETNDKVYVVPYSDHSSYVELVQFVSFLKPCKIIPVVNGSARGPFGISVNDRADMSRFDKYLNVRSTASCNPIPDTVMRYMKGKAFVSLENLNQGRKRKAKKELRRAPGKSMKKGIEYEDSPEKNSQTENVDNENHHSKTETNHDVSVRSFSKSSTLSSAELKVLDFEKDLTDTAELKVLDFEKDLTDTAELKVLDFEKDLTDTSMGSKGINTKDVDTGTDHNEIAASQGFHVTGETDNVVGESQGFILTGDLNSVNEEIVISVESEFEPKTSCSNHVETNKDSKNSFSSDVNNFMDENKDNSNLKVKKLRRKKIRRSLDFVSGSFPVHKSKRFLKVKSPKLKHNDEAQEDNHYSSGNPLSCSSGSNSTEKINDKGGNDNEIKSSPCSDVIMESESTGSDKTTSKDNSRSLLSIQGIHDSREKSGNGSERIVEAGKTETEMSHSDKDKGGNMKNINGKQFHNVGSETDVIVIEDSQSLVETDNTDHSTSSLTTVGDSENTLKADSQSEQKAKDSLNTIALKTAKTPWSFGRSECNRVKEKKAEIEFSKSDKDNHKKHVNDKKLHDTENTKTDEILIEDGEEFSESDKDNHKKTVNGKKLHDTENTKIDAIVIDDSEPSGETSNTSHSENSLSISDSERTSRPVLQIKENTTPNSVDMLFTQTMSEDTAHSTQSGDSVNSEPVFDSNTELDNNPFPLRTSKTSLSSASAERSNDRCLADELFSCTVVTKTSKHSNTFSTDNGLRVLKWHPNMRKIRKQKFHKILTNLGKQ